MLSVDLPDGNAQLSSALREAALGDTPEQAELRGAARGYLAKVMPEAEVRRLMDSTAGIDRDAWRRLANEHGWQGLAIPEQYGGAGYGFAELAVVLSECGRALAFPPMLTTVAIAANLLLTAADEQARANYLPAIAAGELLVAVAGSLEPTGDRDAGRGAEVVAHRSASGGWRLSGRCDFVQDGVAADLILVIARTEDGDVLFACSAAESTLNRTPMATLDLTRKQARLTFEGTPARLIATAADLAQAMRRLPDIAGAALALEQVGGADRILELAVEYAGVREQFGRPIGSFQAIKHKCADLLVDLEAARSATAFAVWAVATEDPSLPLAAAIAQAACSETYSRLAAEAVQIHGGIGFTWEHVAHLYFRRAKGDELFLGDAVRQRARVGALVGLNRG
jgi:alkylation response protein AidB-like acyl-CoA dehydrogenase